MRLLFDTSCLVAALVPSHPSHSMAWRWLDQVLAGDHQGFIANHTLAELYAVLTRLPLRRRILPSEAYALIKANLQQFSIINFDTNDYIAVLDNLEQLGLPGAAVYDALIAWAALKADADGLLTLNPGHFRRLGAQVEALVMVPQP